MIAVRKESDEVLYPLQDPVILDSSGVSELKRLALLNPRQRIRLCAHSAPQDSLHEMFIVHTSECYVRAHKHVGKAESMAILEGEVDVVLFNDDGTLRQVLPMGAPASGRTFYHRISKPVYHMMLIRTPFVVFHEITEGPFLREQTDFPEWAPEQDQPGRVHFLDRVEAMINQKANP